MCFGKAGLLSDMHKIPFSVGSALPFDVKVLLLLLIVCWWSFGIPNEKLEISSKHKFEAQK